MAADYYDGLPYHESWPLVTLKFIFGPEFGVWNRVKRRQVVRTPVVTEDDQGMTESEELKKDR